jgi:hypothetical protein
MKSGMTSQLLDTYVISDRADILAKWFIEFEKLRRKQKALPIEEQEREFIVYHEKISHSNDAEESIKWRHEFLMKNFLATYTDVETKDPQRNFTDEQRLAIYRRDDGKCQLKIKCNGEKCEWGNWEADHIIPHSKGGKTTVANGQVACPVCNAVKNNKC